MTQLALSPWPPGASAGAASSRWLAWFARYIDAREARRRRQRVRRAWQGLDRRSLDDIGVSEARRFLAVHSSTREH